MQAPPFVAGPFTTKEGEAYANDFLEVFKCLDVHTVVRLNRPAYRKSVFKNAGFKHLDLFFADCSVPSDSVVDAFLTRAEALAPGQVMARGFCSSIY